MRNSLKSTLFGSLLLFVMLLSAGCTDLDDVNSRLDRLEVTVEDLQSAVTSLQQAYDDGKVITEVTPLESEEGGWMLTFSDKTSIQLINGKNGIVSSIESDEQSHQLTLTLSNGQSFTFYMSYVSPTGIVLLSAGTIELGWGEQADIEFRVNPSNAVFNYDLSSGHCEIELDCIGTSTRSYTHSPVHYRLSHVEQMYDGESQEPLAGQYRATIQDMQSSISYSDRAALVLNVQDGNGDKVQLSSSVFEIKSTAFHTLHTGLPLVVIDTPDGQGITSKDVYVENSSVSTFLSDRMTDIQGIMKIKGRGNSTWSAPKKPYKMKFDSKTSVYGNPKDKTWILLANYYDPTMLRNSVALFMGESMSRLDYTPRFCHVDFILNGSYQGTYQMGEQIKIATNRVNVGDDGFLLEVDAKADASDITFRTNHLNVPFNIKDPDVEIDSEDYQYVKDFVTMAEDILYGAEFLDPEHGYTRYIDMDSFVEWYLVNEITENNDACFFTSCYMNLKRGEKIKMGPLWDFDIAFGNSLWNESSNNPERFWIKTSGWYARLFLDPAFVSKVKSRFNDYYVNKQKIFDKIDADAALLEKSAIANNKLWGTICSKNASDEEVSQAYRQHVETMKNWLQRRFEWLNGAINAL